MRIINGLRKLLNDCLLRDCDYRMTQIALKLKSFYMGKVPSEGGCICRNVLDFQVIIVNVDGVFSGQVEVRTTLQLHMEGACIIICIMYVKSSC